MEIFLETSNIILRNFKPEDENQMFKNYCNDETVCKYLTWKPHKSKEDTKQFLSTVLDGYKQGILNLAIVYKETGEVVGSVSVVWQDVEKGHYELGWVLGQKFWNRGIMTNAAKAVIDYLFINGAQLIKAKCDCRNLASGRVMSKIGMLYAGIEEDIDYIHAGGKSDIIHFQISKRDYFNNLNYNPEYHKFLKAWGLESQLKMMIEEMSELTKEICKHFRKGNPDEFDENLIKETADVLNTIEQLRYIVGSEEVDKVRKEKMLRALSYL